MKHPKVIAHRGNSHQAPENTYIAFRQAINLHVDFIECDVQISKDGVPVIIHDSTFHRISKSHTYHPINALDLEDIKTIDAGSWFDPKFSDQRILTLEELLCMPKGKVGVMIEIKKETFAACDLMGNIISDVLNFVEPITQQYGPVLVGSLSPSVLLCLKPFLQNHPFIPIIKEMSRLEEFRPLKAKHYALHYSVARRKIINRLHEEGAEVWVWTVDDKPRAKRLMDRGVDGLITNHPKKMMHLHSRIEVAP